MWVNKPATKVKIKLCEIGPAINHNLICWLCDKEPAVYDMYPNWVFRPCWDCQKKMKDQKISAWDKAKNLFFGEQK